MLVKSLVLITKRVGLVPISVNRVQDTFTIVFSSPKNVKKQRETQIILTTLHGSHLCTKYLQVVEGISLSLARFQILSLFESLIQSFPR